LGKAAPPPVGAVVAWGNPSPPAPPPAPPPLEQNWKRGPQPRERPPENRPPVGPRQPTRKTGPFFPGRVWRNTLAPWARKDPNLPPASHPPGFPARAAPPPPPHRFPPRTDPQPPPLGAHRQRKGVFFFSRIRRFGQHQWKSGPGGPLCSKEKNPFPFERIFWCVPSLGRDRPPLGQGGKTNAPASQFFRSTWIVPGQGKKFAPGEKNPPPGFLHPKMGWFSPWPPRTTTTAPPSRPITPTKRRKIPPGRGPVFSPMLFSSPLEAVSKARAPPNQRQTAPKKLPFPPAWLSGPRGPPLKSARKKIPKKSPPEGPPTGRPHLNFFFK